MSIRKNFDSFLSRFEKRFSTHNLIEVSRSAILHNLDTFTKLTDKQVIPVLKGNAYGHGIELVATALKKQMLPYIAVDGYFEALRIREVSEQPVLIMGAILPENFARIKYRGFAFVVQDAETIRRLGQTGKHIKVHLECNTGMNRYGAEARELASLTKLILSYKNLELEGIMSHLADSDGDNAATVTSAVKRFDSCVETVRAAGANPGIIHIAQSAGSIQARSAYANTIRLGIGLYGINPFPPAHRMHAQLKGKLHPALRLTSTITKTTQLKKGDKVSYNYTYTAPKDIHLGVLPLGYYEGLNRALSNVGTVKIGPHTAPIVGRVCMNHTMIDLSLTDGQAGDTVTVYSNDPSDANSVENIAQKHGLFSYGLLTALNSDVRRVLTD